MSNEKAMGLYFLLVEALAAILLCEVCIDDHEAYAREIVAAIELLREQTNVLKEIV